MGIRVGGRGPGVRALRKEAVWDMDSGLVDFHMKGILLAGKSFTHSRNWLTLEGIDPPVSARPQMSQHQNTENKKTCFIQRERGEIWFSLS